MDSRRDVKRTMEKEIKKGSAPILYSGLRFDVDTYHLVENEEKLNHVLDYLFRNGEFANLADKQIRSNIYLDTFMGKMNFRSTKNELDRRALEATAKRYIMKKQPTFENNVYVENLICCFDIAEEEMKKRQCIYKGQDIAALIFTKKHLECLFLQCLMDRKEVINRQPVPSEYSEDMKRIYMLDNVDGLHRLEAIGAVQPEDNLAFQIADRYVTIHSCEDGYDYNIYDENYKLLDGGVYDNPNYSIREALRDVVDDLKSDLTSGIRGNVKQDDDLVKIDNDELSGLIEKAEQAQMSQLKERAEYNYLSETDIKENVLAYVQTQFDELNEYNPDFGLEIVDAAIYGSRSRGVHTEQSDIDIVVEYAGNMKESALFNVLYEDWSIGGSKSKFVINTSFDNNSVRECQMFSYNRLLSARQIIYIIMVMVCKSNC